LLFQLQPANVHKIDTYSTTTIHYCARQLVKSERENRHGEWIKYNRRGTWCNCEVVKIVMTEARSEMEHRAWGGAVCNGHGIDCLLAGDETKRRQKTSCKDGMKKKGTRKIKWMGEVWGGDRAFE